MYFECKRHVTVEDVCVWLWGALIGKETRR